VATTSLLSISSPGVYFGNAAGPADSSAVVARTADEAVARRVARYLSIGIVRPQPDSTLHLEATVILGRDGR